jgi:hypothetical protein
VRGIGILGSSYAGSGINRTQTSRLQLRASTTPHRFAQHLGAVHKDALLWIQHHRRRKETWYGFSALGTLNPYQDRLYTLARRACGEVPSVRQCQKCQKPSEHPLALLAPCWVISASRKLRIFCGERNDCWATSKRSAISAKTLWDSHDGEEDGPWWAICARRKD